LKKVIIIILSIILLLTSYYAFTEKNEQLSVEFLYPENQEVVGFEMNPGISISEMITNLEGFSLEHNISIVQTHVLLNFSINIYATNIENNSNIRLVRGEYPSGTNYISNSRYQEGNASQSGQFQFPVSNIDIRIYDMGQARNIGIMESFQLIDADDEIVTLFIEEFSAFGTISRSQDSSLGEYIEFSINYAISEMSFSTAFIFSFFTLFILTCFFLIRCQRRMMLEQLWGYSFWSTIFSVPKVFLLPYIASNFLIFLVMVITLVVNDNQSFIVAHTMNILPLNLAVGGLFLLFLVIAILLTKKFNSMVLSLKGKSFFERIQWTSFIIKTISSFALLGIIVSFWSTVTNLREEIEDLSYWRQAENVFHVRGAFAIGSGLWEDYEVDDGAGGTTRHARILDAERLNQGEMIQRDFFFLIERYSDAFILDSNFFWRTEIEDFYQSLHHQLEENPFFTLEEFERLSTALISYSETREWLYDYEYERLRREHIVIPQLIQAIASGEGWADPMELYLMESGMYDLAGRNITISENYLLQNPIHDVYGGDVRESFIHDPYTMNILLPEHYREYESDLEAYFLTDFYFERVSITNWYLEEVGLPLLDITIGDLSINFIYTASGQPYFTFNRHSGDEYSLIWDPIVIVHHPETAVANFSTRVHNSTYFVDNSRGQAFDNIRPFIDEVGAHEIQAAVSVFYQGQEGLVTLQWELFQQTLNLIMNAVFLLLLSALLIWSYYSLNAYKINLEYLFGYSYLSRNSELLIFSLTTTVIATTLAIFSRGFSFLLFGFALIIFIVDFIIIGVLGNHLMKKLISSIVKGSEL